MNRRDFFRRSALLAAGVVAADQLDLMDRLGWKRKLFPGWSPRIFPNLGPLDAGPISVATNRPIVIALVDQYGQELGRAPIVDGIAKVTVLGGSAYMGDLRWVCVT